MQLALPADLPETPKEFYLLGLEGWHYDGTRTKGYVELLGSKNKWQTANVSGPIPPGDPYYLHLRGGKKVDSHLSIAITPLPNEPVPTMRLLSYSKSTAPLGNAIVWGTVPDQNDAALGWEWRLALKEPHGGFMPANRLQQKVKGAPAVQVTITRDQASRTFDWGSSSSQELLIRSKDVPEGGEITIISHYPAILVTSYKQFLGE